MRLTHPQYVKLVFGTYQLLRSAPDFSPALKQPTPAGARNECITVYKERPDNNDAPALRSFFGPAENNSFLGAIENTRPEGFKTFTNYLKGKAVNTDDKNVELLAWLINFSHRPYRFGMDVVLNETEKAILSNEGQIDEEDDKTDHSENETAVKAVPAADKEAPVVPIVQPTQNDQVSSEVVESRHIDLILVRKWIIIGGSLLFILFTLGFFLFYEKDDQCMYWKDDHYERVDCDAEVNDKIAFDEERWKNFRKITDISTITKKSIGVVHYYGNKNREFYTMGGKHPIETTRYLKVMTPYIWEKEFGAKDSLTKDSAATEIKKPIVHQ